MNKKSTAMIILNYNDYENTKKYIDLIKKYDSIDRIVIVDNNSSDESYSILKKIKDKKVKLIKTDKNLGYAYGNNFGVHYLEKSKEKYDYIIISNPDVYIDNDTIKKCILFLNKNKDVAICAPRMYNKNNIPSELSGWKERKLNSDVRDSSKLLSIFSKTNHVERYSNDYMSKPVVYVDCVAGSFFIIKYDIFKKINYFDENTFLYFEEDIIGKKIKMLGYKNAILNNCSFIHYGSITISKTFKNIKKYTILQASKRYYHSVYNEECSGFGKIQLNRIDVATCLGKYEIKHPYSFYNKMNDFIVNNGKRAAFFKIIIFLLIFIFWPFKYVIRKLRKKKKICYFSLVTWKWIKQRPHFVASKISETCDVDYMYTLPYRHDEKSSNFVNNKVSNSNLKIKPFIVDYNSPIKNSFILFRSLFYNYDKIIFTQPHQIDYFFVKVLKINGTDIYYECMDNYIGWEKDINSFESEENYLINNSKYVFVSSQSLLEKLSKKYKIKRDKMVLVRNGYSSSVFDNYTKVVTNLSDKINVTYIGTIDEWFDFDSIINYANNHNNVVFNIIGPIGATVQKRVKSIKNKNIKFYSPIEHDFVPSYIEDSDVMLIPFKINEIIKYVDPVKMYEYLYFKKPIVSSYWKELEQFNGLVYFYNDSNDFEKELDKAIKKGFNINNNFSKIMHESKWENRLKKYVDIIKK